MRGSIAGDASAPSGSAIYHALQQPSGLVAAGGFACNHWAGSTLSERSDKE
ncbi:hypothetical protein O206_12630 [Ochrobactrum sp. EGD-AQ16]|jgi:hypothetical protein|nr:hypothetical protein O206_12630 [Ochrobactrum sp. EGD-AQ16]